MIPQRVLESFTGKYCLVTGGTGLIGRQVVEILSKAGANVDVVSLDFIDLGLPNVETYRCDLRQPDVCRDLVTGCDYVFHLAGVKGSVEVTKSKPASFFVPLLQFNTNVLEACKELRVEKVIYTSSIGAYESAEVFVEGDITQGPPMDLFPGWAKRMAELQIQAYKIQHGLNNFTVVRPCNVYGPGDNFDPENAMFIPSLMSKIHRGDNPVMIWGDGTVIRDFAFSRDVAEGIILALYYQPDVPYLNLGSGVGVSVKELVETMNRVVSFNYKFDITKPSGFPKRVMNIEKAMKLIDYNPITTLEQGLRETWEWFIKNEEEYKQRKNYFSEEE
jgi:GDP-L-fucose synthase